MAEVAKNPSGIGYVGLAYINSPGIKVITIDGIEPSKAAVLAKKYPYARPTFYYTNGEASGEAAKFLAFTLGYSPKKFEFLECTPEFIANVNVIPQMLGSPADETQIQSFYVPFSCESCKRVENLLFERSAIKMNAATANPTPALRIF